MQTRIDRLHDDLVSQSVRDHAELTSGRVSAQQLRRMGHPFGRLGGQGSDTGARGIVRGRESLSDAARRKGNVIRKTMLMPLPINRQTGRLRASFFSRGPFGPHRTYELGFSAPHARYVLSPIGTERMVARGFYSARPGATGLDMGAIAKRFRARLAGAARYLREIS